MHITERVLTRKQRLALELLARGEPLHIYEAGFNNHGFYMVRVRSTGWHIGAYLKGLRARRWVRYARDLRQRPTVELTPLGWREFSHMQLEWPAAINWDYGTELPIREQGE